jgi:hypothetical protein
MYFKGALFIHTLRASSNDDAKVLQLLRDSLRRIQVQEQLTEEIVAYVSSSSART